MFVNPETLVATGRTDGFRYIGIAPPLNEEEVNFMSAAGVIGEYSVLTQIDEFEPACTLIRLTDPDLETLPPRSKDGYVMAVCSRMADLLTGLREGRVKRHLEPIDMMGHNSSPFVPDTDSMRYQTV